MKPKRPVSKRPRAKPFLLVDVLAEDQMLGVRPSRERKRPPMSDEALEHFIELYQGHLASIVAEMKRVGCLPGLFALYAAAKHGGDVVYGEIEQLASSPDHAEDLSVEALGIAREYGGMDIIASQVLEQPEGVA